MFHVVDTTLNYALVLKMLYSMDGNSGKLEIGKYFLENGAKTNIKYPDVLTAIDFAHRNEMLSLLTAEFNSKLLKTSCKASSNAFPRI
jgi:hypothetical protein